MPDSKVDLLNIDSSEVEEQRILRTSDTTAASLVTRNQISPVGTTTSGALATQQFVSGAGASVSTTRDVETHTPVTATTAAPAITVALSPDNSTYSTLAVVSPAVNAGITDIVVRVPAGWFLRFTAVNATLGVTTFY